MARETESPRMVRRKRVWSRTAGVAAAVLFPIGAGEVLYSTFKSLPEIEKKADAQASSAFPVDENARAEATRVSDQFHGQLNAAIRNNDHNAVLQLVEPESLSIAAKADKELQEIGKQQEKQSAEWTKLSDKATGRVVDRSILGLGVAFLGLLGVFVNVRLSEPKTKSPGQSVHSPVTEPTV